MCLGDQRVADVGACALFAAIPYSNLRTLNLKSNNITDACCAALNELFSTKGVCHLEVLVLANNRITDEGLEIFLPGLEVNTTLHALDLSHNMIGITGMRSLKDCLMDNTALQAISLVGNTSTDDHGCEQFLRSRVLWQVAAEIKDNEDFFKQYKSYDIKHIHHKHTGTLTHYII